ncbi:MAG TPA: hypothetical protein VLB75_00775 [Steroidobacteraceae bacterium]|nr:hypothetical protein [Steroidobacteraceae bacterium]
MTTQATLAWQTASAVLATLLSSATWAGTVSGRIAFPGRTPPAATVYLRGLDGLTLRQQPLRRGETEFSLEVPAGRYWIFARPDEPELAGLYGAHTLFSLCNRAGTEEASGCSDHALAAVDVPATGLMTANVDDWMLSEETAAELDGILGAAPAALDSAELGKPRFSEYRVPRAPDQPAAALDLASEPRAAPFAAQLQEAELTGSNFAGRFTLVRVACGEHCARVAIVDLANGAIALPEELSQGLGSLPCRTDRELDFREDSRLLEFTRLEAEAVVTDYLLWDGEQRKLAPLAQYRRSLERFCDGATQ